MIYELRTYTTPPGKAPLLAQYSAEIARPIRGDEYGRLEGYWMTEVGPLNKCMHLWSFDDLAHRQERRA
ncbi:MAG: NIPSNAP family protein, partial [Alphaproteobacteria bacterium]|nr:NIPSNAP family protein [Alphaproteobacteria bacterium]